MNKDKLSHLSQNKYLILGLLLSIIQYLIFAKNDFIIFGALCLHHIPEVFSFLFFGFWLANNFPMWITLLIYTINPFLSELLFRHNITFGGIIASAMVSLTLLIGDLTERYQQRKMVPED